MTAVSLDRQSGPVTLVTTAVHVGPGKEEMGIMHSLTITRALQRAGLVALVAGTAAAAPAFAQGQAAAPAAPAYTTADLARACGPAADDANAVAHRSVCYATLVTVGQMHHIYTANRRGSRPVFCMPNPSPTMEQVSAAFVSWAAAHQQDANLRAAEGVLRFGAATYPCPQPAARRR